jgi:hypothetical protein
MKVLFITWTKPKLYEADTNLFIVDMNYFYKQY